jgi:predicted ATP-grasp superfamily ATP-dependent carboligase
MRCDVLVGYAWCRSSYVAIRSLSRLGLRVATADSTKFGMGQCSRHTATHYVHAEPRFEPEQFITDIGNILTDCKAKFYLPGHDEGETVAKYRSRLPKDVIVPLADHDMLLWANNKMETSKTAIELDIPTPRIIHWDEIGELKQKVAALGKPVVIKLRRSSGAKGVFYANSSDNAVSIVNRLIKQFALLPDRYPVVQEKVPGEGWGVSCLYHRGEQVTSFTHRRLREKIVSGGTSTLRESAHNQQMQEYAHKLLDSLGWHGLAMVEFKWDPVTQRPWFIEVNPRLWGSIALPVACGVDFPAMTYFAATRGVEKARQLNGNYEVGIKARWYLGDLILGASLLAKCRPIEALRLLLPGKEDLYDDILWDDIGATAAEFVSYLMRFLKFRSTNPLDRGALG